MRVSLCAVVLVSLGSVGCGSGDDDTADDGQAGTGGESVGGTAGTSGEGAGGTSGEAQGGSAGTTGGSAGTSGGSAGTSGGSAGTSGSGAGTSGSGGSSGTGLVTPPGSEPEAMPLISRDVPAFASSNDANAPPERANDEGLGTAWLSTSMPAWLAYDLSGVPEERRGQVLVAWYDPAAPDYLNPMADAGKHLARAYEIEINTAAGGGDAPADGWTSVASVNGNDRSTRQHLVDIGGANWVRINVTESSDPAAVALDLDIHSAPNGATDSWLMMGDSITFMATMYAFSDLPKLVNAIDPERYPAIVPAGIGGTNTTTAVAAIDETMRDFPGRFVALCYGTNDHAHEYQMETLVQKVIAAGKVPVVPRMPWSDTEGIQLDGPLINAQVNALYEAYPEIYPGPDMWAAFENRLDLMPTGDIHPNEPGQREWRAQWAAAMTR